ncbi:uncharacterized protein LOC120202679 [Hibiscus syriacus]|uniref:uncharacterized protein LOC120202679 n=1 Tax=Hibiscus syriacus TaxID=106335 RepID=UPI0019219757|nr:uncharacterized protein LOC120202679 [Hibiscus syriacus]
MKRYWHWGNRDRSMKVRRRKIHERQRCLTRYRPRMLQGLRYAIFVGMQDEKICLLYVASAPMVQNTLTVCEKCFGKFLKEISSVKNASWLRKLKAKSKVWMLRGKRKINLSQVHVS